MANMKIVTVVGARPQFVKAAAVSRAFAGLKGRAGAVRVDEQILHTGQHYDENMSKVFFEELRIPPPFINLEIGSGSHGQQTGAMLGRLEAVLLEQGPDWLLVYGDTNSTLAGALAAAKLHIPVAHVEAGLRSYNRRMPEEINRLVADRVSALLLCPTATAVANLANEGITKGVHQVGDVMYDSVLFNARLAEQASDIMSRLERWTGQSVGIEHQEAKAMLGVCIVKDFFREDISLDTAMSQVTSYAVSDMFYL
ncbi:hypothetical protein LCGC14_1980320, partial [marine sediment metagenome]